MAVVARVEARELQPILNVVAVLHTDAQEACGSTTLDGDANVAGAKVVECDCIHRGDCRASRRVTLARCRGKSVPAAAAEGQHLAHDVVIAASELAKRHDRRLPCGAARTGVGLTPRGGPRLRANCQRAVVADTVWMRRVAGRGEQGGR